jgi:phosphohistidine phosphatase
MHRRLILMRHAKSSWATDAASDHERPLNPRGRTDAPRMAKFLLDQGWAPSEVHLSDARRTIETWDRMAAVLPSCPATRHPSLYLAGLPSIVHVARDWPADGEGPILVLGHNPGFEQAASWLSRATVHLTTANVVLLEGAGPSWTQALEAPWKLVAWVRPKDL